jgi:5-methylcytosine-specific restriction endonuclease McrA
MPSPVEFPEDVVRAAFDRCGGQCECELKGCRHPAGCPEVFMFEDRATSNRRGWQAHHKVPVAEGGTGTLENCQILCMDCHTTVHLSS